MLALSERRGTSHRYKSGTAIRPSAVFAGAWPRWLLSVTLEVNDEKRVTFILLGWTRHDAKCYVGTSK